VLPDRSVWGAVYNSRVATGTLETITLRDSGLDDVFLFWRYGNQRHAVITGDYGTARDYLDRLLTRYLHAGHCVRSVHAGIGVLRECGTSVPVVVREHCLGLMRPWLASEDVDLVTADPPFVIAFEPRDGAMPSGAILAANRAECVRLVRQLQQERGVDLQGWRGYSCERLRGALERLVLDVVDGRTPKTFKTELERQLVFAEYRRRRR